MVTYLTPFPQVKQHETTIFVAQLAREKKKHPSQMEITIFQRMNFQLVFAVRFMECRSRKKPWDPAFAGSDPPVLSVKCRLPYFWYELFSKKKQENAPKVALNLFFFALLAIWYDTSTLWITTSLPMLGNWMFSLIFRLGKLQEATLWRVGCRDRLTSSPTAAVTFRGVLFHRTLRRQGKTATWYYVCTRFFFIICIHMYM